MLYFAYGSNMKTARLSERCPSARPVGVASADGWRLCFNKSSTDGTGKANIVKSDNSTTLGVLFEIQEHEVRGLDMLEEGYDPLHNFRVTRDGVERYAFTYSAEPSRVDDSLSPSEDYLNLILEGAEEHDLPASYIRSISELARR